MNRAILLACMVLLAQAFTSASAAAREPEESVTAGQKALQRWNKYPWYDAKHDDVQPVILAERKVEPPAEREMPAGLGEMVQVLARIGLALLLAAIAFVLVRAFLMQQRDDLPLAAASDDGDAARIESLPFPVAAGRLDLLAEARRHYEAGNYEMAIIYLFSFQLVQLDKRQFIHLAKGKTNRQYLREVGQRMPLLGVIEQTMVAFEDVFFGNRALDRNRFQSCWTRLDEFERAHGASAKGARMNRHAAGMLKRCCLVCHWLCQCWGDSATKALAEPVAHGARCTIKRCLLALVPLLPVALTGCDRDVETEYGQRSGPYASASVNGTAVLGEMFEQAGHKVTSWQSLSPRLSKRADCIVWFPDDFNVPSHKVCEWLEKWLNAKPGRTLIYVGRDFDAAPWYWEKVQPLAPPEQKATVGRRLAAARADFQSRRDQSAKIQDCKWFSIERWDRSDKVRKISKDSEWLADINPAKLEMERCDKLDLAPWADTLLETEDAPLVGSVSFGASELIVVDNGSFLLNAMLVNHEHRKLAGKLIDRVAGSGKNVVFLESGRDGPPIRESDPTASASSGLEVFHIWPTNWILLHLAAVGIALCFARWPIFGQPRQAEAVAASDFGRHIDALAALLSRSRNHSFAMSRVVHYQQMCVSAGPPVRPAAPSTNPDHTPLSD